MTFAIGRDINGQWHWAGFEDQKFLDARGSDVKGLGLAGTIFESPYDEVTGAFSEVNGCQSLCHGPNPLDSKELCLEHIGLVQNSQDAPIIDVTGPCDVLRGVATRAGLEYDVRQELFFRKGDDRRAIGSGIDVELLRRIVLESKGVHEHLDTGQVQG